MQTLRLCLILFAMIVSASNHAWGQTKTILTSFYPIYIMALNVTHDVPDVTVVNMTPPVTGCLHDYRLTPGDMKKIEKADLLILNGAGMESFLQQTLKSAKCPVIDASKGIPLTNQNPHVWVSISRAIQQVQTIGTELAKVDPAHAGLYKKNTRIYVQSLTQLKRDMKTALAPYKGQSIITFHEAFPYFAEEFGLQIPAVIDREPGTNPNAREIRDTIQTISKYRVKALFTEPQYPGKTADIISRETHVPIYTLDPAVTGPDLPNAYLTIMRQNLATLKKALH